MLNLNPNSDIKKDLIQLLEKPQSFQVSTSHNKAMGPYMEIKTEDY
jgi:hypothetical protein